MYLLLAALATLAIDPREVARRLEVLEQPENLGFLRNCNAASRLAQGEFIVFLNNDMLVAPDFLAQLLRHFDHSEVFAVTARIEMAAPPRASPSSLVRMSPVRPTAL